MQAGHFGPNHVFMDIDQIEPGEVFDNVIQEKLKAVQAAVVLIGPCWLDIAEANGERRLEDPDDWVRLEIAALLERDIRVIPVLVDSAMMPKSTQLPGSLAALARRQAHEISDWRFHEDVNKLIRVLEKDLQANATSKSSSVTDIAQPLEVKLPEARLPFEPEMVRIHVGKFLMGSDDDPGERPIHEITIGYEFEIGKYPVTFDEYDAFAKATQRTLPDDHGWGRSKRPVINVS
jgi:hypothetical protein